MPPPNHVLVVDRYRVLKCIDGMLGFLGCKTTLIPVAQYDGSLSAPVYAAAFFLRIFLKLLKYLLHPFQLNLLFQRPKSQFLYFSFLQNNQIQLNHFVTFLFHFLVLKNYFLAQKATRRPLKIRQYTYQYG